MGLANVLCELDYTMYLVNGTIQCALGMGLSNVCREKTSQCALGMGLSNVPWEWDNPMCPGKKLANVPWEWD